MLLGVQSSNFFKKLSTQLIVFCYVLRGVPRIETLIDSTPFVQRQKGHFLQELSVLLTFTGYAKFRGKELIDYLEEKIKKQSM